LRLVVVVDLFVFLLVVAAVFEFCAETAAAKTKTERTTQMSLFILIPPEQGACWRPKILKRVKSDSGHHIVHVNGNQAIGVYEVIVRVVIVGQPFAATPIHGKLMLLAII